MVPDPFDRKKLMERTFTVGDLDDMVRNFSSFCCGESALYQPKIKIGHKEDTELPAAGKVAGLWREGDDLYSAFGEVPLEVKDWMTRGLLQSISIEGYDSPKQAGFPANAIKGASGMVLRLVSLLGAHPPQVKGLGNPPWSEAGWSFGEEVACHVFGEVGISRERLMETAIASGLSQTFLDMLDDAQLTALILELADATTATMTGATTATSPPPNMTAGEPLERRMDREQLTTALVTLGQDTDVLAAMDEPSLTDLHRSLSTPATTKMGEGTKPAAVQAPPVNSGTAIAQLAPSTIRQYAEATARAAVARGEAAKRKKSINDFCTRMITEGRVSPGMVDPKDGPTRKRLERASAVLKFGEDESELELQMKEIESGPVIYKFGEKLKGVPAGQQEKEPPIDPERRTRLLSGSPEGRAILKAEAGKK